MVIIPAKCLDKRPALVERSISGQLEKLVEIIDSTRTFNQQALDAITKAKELEEPLHIDKLGEMEALLKEWDEKGLSERLEVEKKGYTPFRSPSHCVVFV